MATSWLNKDHPAFGARLARLKQFFNPLGRLQWKLMLIYALTTTVTILLLEVAGLALMWYFTFRSEWLPDQLGREVAQSAADLAPYLLPSALLLIPATALIGMLLGFVTAHSLTGRLQRLTEAATAWGQGDFDRLTHDTSGDELGQLARHLNHMAIQLQHLLETRQELATLEERNRLARDLHDSIKQQVFATAMQVATAQALLPHDPEAAQAHLAESRRLVQQTQQELTGLIHELRPAALEGRGLPTALREHAAEWSQQTGMPLAISLQGERPLPLLVEQTIFRVVQEGLTNVARHSQATAAELHLAWVNSEITLTIADNGQGFVPATAGKKSLGLRGMRERVEALGGRFAIHSQPGQGTRLDIRLPQNAGKP